MAKITKGQYIKWDSMLSGGFRFDLQGFALRGEKNAIANIKLEDGRILQARLLYTEEREGYRYTGRQIPEIHLSIWNDCGNGMMSSRGLGKYIPIGDIQDKRNWNYLCQISATLDAEKVLELANKHMGQLNNPLVMAATA